jgi:hypothetical protein
MQPKLEINNSNDDGEDNKQTLHQWLKEQFSKYRILRVVGLTSASFVSMSSIHLLIHYLLKKGYFVDRKKIAKFTLDDWVTVCEKIPSSIHAAFSALLAMYINVYDDKFFVTGNIWTAYPPEWMDKLCSLCLGFALYDLGTMVIQGYNGADMWIHHILAAASYILCMWYKRGAIISRMWITEMTVLPTNAMWYVNKFKGKNNAMYKALLVVRMIFYLVFRVGVAPYLIYRALTEGQLETYLNSTIDIKIIIATILGILGVLNIYWTATICKNTVTLLRN